MADAMEDQNPYDNPALREAFRRGWKAWVRGEARYVDEIYKDSERGQAWIEGFEAAEEQEGL